MNNREIAQEISNRIGNSPVPFDSVYSIALQIYNELGGEETQFDSVYSILLEILPLVEGGSDNPFVYNPENGSISNIAFSPEGETYVNSATGQNALALGQGNTVSGEGSAVIGGQGNTVTGDVTTCAGGYNNTFSGSYSLGGGQKNTITANSSFVAGRNNNVTANTAGAMGYYNDVSGVGAFSFGYGQSAKHNTVAGRYSIGLGCVVTTNNDAEISLGTKNVSHSSNPTGVNSAADTQLSVGLKKSDILQESTNGLEIMQNGDMYVLGVGGYDGIHIKSQTGYESTKTLQDVIGGLSLEAGQNIEIADNKIAAKGYFYDDEPKEELKAIDDILAEAGLPLSLGLKVSGAAGATTYTYTDNSGLFPQIIQYGMLPGVGATYQTANGKSGVIAAVDATTITFEETLDADSALTNESVDYVVETKTIHSFIAGNSSPVKFDVTNIYGGNISGAAGATTYTYTNGNGSTFVALLFKTGWILEISNGRSATIKSVDYTNKTVTFDKTLDANNAISNEMVLYETVFPIASNEYSYVEGGISAFGMYLPNAAIGIGAHAEGGATTASGIASHAEGSNTTASGQASHAEGANTTASGQASHAEGDNTAANGIASHAECSGTASGDYSHAEGGGTASGDYSHAEGEYTTAQNFTEHAEGKGNVSHRTSSTYGNAGNTQHSVGIGTSYGPNQKNAFEIMQNGDMYVYGVGGYQGTNTNVQDASIKTLQAYIASLEARIAALEGNTTVE